MITAREGLQERDYKHTMDTARRRFRLERKAAIPTTLDGFRTWARKTYTPSAAFGKLRALLGGRRR